MIYKQELIECFERAALDSYMVDYAIDENGKNAIKLIPDDLDRLIMFAKKHAIDTVFYNYVFFDVESMTINQSIQQDICSEMNIEYEALIVLQDEFIKYNEKIENLDFDRPIQLNVFCIYQ